MEYGLSKEKDPSFRVIADHIRASVFLLSEGLVPSNEGRGYVLRRVIRRASRHARLLNLHEPCLYKLIDSVITVMGDYYPDIKKEKKRTQKLFKIEEENFLRTFETGMNILDDIMKQVKIEGLSVIPGEEIFKLYDTSGFPFDSAQDIAMDAGLTIDKEGFNREMDLQRQRSKGETTSRAAITLPLLQIKASSEFIGYENLNTESIIVDILKDNKSVAELTSGEEGFLLLDKTPFYGETGGQVGDTGTISSKSGHVKVLDTKKINSHFIHIIKVERGQITKGDKVTCSVDEERRRSIMRNHTATHLLHKALREVLGDHVKQSGSVVDQERLRFDFTHFSAVSSDEMTNIETIVNSKVLENLPVRTEIMSIDEAVKAGAVALFDEKYGDTVRVISAGDFSKELCGGTHCKSTGEIGLCVIVSEGSVASGIRRIEALTGKNALDYLKQKKSELDGIKGLLKTETPREKIEKLITDMKSLEKEVQRLKTGSTSNSLADVMKDVYEVDGVKVAEKKPEGLKPDELRLYADNIRDRLKSGIIVASSVIDNQAAIICMVTKDLKNRYHAGKIMKSIAKLAGGNGGGKPDMAQGGTKQIEKLDKALESLHDIIAEQSKASS
jgi:alanyl-tRNA synthetase